MRRQDILWYSISLYCLLVVFVRQRILLFYPFLSLDITTTTYLLSHNRRPAKAVINLQLFRYRFRA